MIEKFALIGELGVHQYSKLVDCVRVNLCECVFVCVSVWYVSSQSWLEVFRVLFETFLFLQEWRRLSSGKDSACACLRNFPCFYFLDGFMLIVNCQQKWYLLSMPCFSSNLLMPVQSMGLTVPAKPTGENKLKRNMAFCSLLHRVRRNLNIKCFLSLFSWLITDENNSRL